MDFALARPSFKLSYFISEEETLMLLLSFGNACIGSDEAISVMYISGTTTSCSCLDLGGDVSSKWTSFP